MKLSLRKVEALCDQQGIAVTQLLRASGVSRNSYYSLARKQCVVPESMLKISEYLNVPISQLLDDVPPSALRMRQLMDEVSRITAKHAGTEPDNVRHTLLLLAENPVDRLRRALRRGRPTHLR